MKTQVISFAILFFLITALTVGATDLNYRTAGNSDRCPTSCAAQFSGNGDAPSGDRADDGMVSFMEHLLNEVVTNSLGTAWYDRHGVEDFDECQGTFEETYQTSNSALEKIRIAARDYLIRQSRINDWRSRCALAYQ